MPSLREKLREPGPTGRRRFGYRRLHILLRREGVNDQTARRPSVIYREEGLAGQAATEAAGGLVGHQSGPLQCKALPETQRWSLDLCMTEWLRVDGPVLNVVR